MFATDNIVAFIMTEVVEMWYYMLCFCKVQQLHI